MSMGQTGIRFAEFDQRVSVLARSARSVATEGRGQPRSARARRFSSSPKNFASGCVCLRVYVLKNVSS